MDTVPAVTLVVLPTVIFTIMATEVCQIMCNMYLAPCGLRGCKNGPDPFTGRMSYKATKPGLAVCHTLACFLLLLLFIRAPFYVLLVFIVCVLSFGCSS